MQKYARVVEKLVIETIRIPDGASIGDYFVPDVAAQFIACPDNVEANWAYENEEWKDVDKIIHEIKGNQKKIMRIRKNKHTKTSLI